MLSVPSFALRLALGDCAGTLLDGQNPVPEAALAHGFEFKYEEFAACLRDVVWATCGRLRRCFPVPGPT